MLALTSCGPNDETADPHTKALLIWEKHEAVLVSIAEDKWVGSEQFEESCAFFEMLMGVSIPGDLSFTEEWTPTKYTATAIKPLEEWYKANSDALYWDATTGEVRVQANVEAGERVLPEKRPEDDAR